MLHACFTPIALYFVYTLWHFYVFFRTNLLTRCHSVSSCFLQFLCFRKVIQEIFSELDEMKAKVPIYLTRRRSPKEKRRAARRRSHHRVARAIAWPCQHVVWAPRPPSDIALPPINSLHRENPKGLIRLKCIYNFWCSMLVYAPFALCFVTLRGIFYAFFGKPIDEMPQCQFPVFCCFVFQKSYIGNILGIGRNEAQTFYFFWTQDKDRRRAGGGLGTHHTRGGAPPFWPHQSLWPPPLRLFKSFRSRNPNGIVDFLERVPQLRCRHQWISGDRSLCSGTLLGRGSAPGAISIDSIIVDVYALLFL
jgi:hypothetical protein